MRSRSPPLEGRGRGGACDFFRRRAARCIFCGVFTPPRPAATPPLRGVGSGCAVFTRRELCSCYRRRAAHNDTGRRALPSLLISLRAIADGYVTETGTGIAKILPPSNPFLPESGEKKKTVIEKLKNYLSRFLGTTEPVNIKVTIEHHYHGTIDNLTIKTPE